MAVSSTTNKVAYDGDNSTTEFAFSHPIRAAAEMAGVIYNETTGAETALVAGTNCTVSVASDYTSATVTISASAGTAPYGVLSTNEKVFLNREVPDTNTLSYTDFSGTLAENFTEAIDRLNLQCQRLQEQVDRCLKIQMGEDSTNPDYTTAVELPTLTGLDTDGKYLKFVSDGDATPVHTLAFDTAASPNTVTNAGTSTDNAVPKFDGTTGKIIQNSGVIIDDSNNVTGAASLNINSTIAVVGTIDDDTMATATATNIATSESIKAYVDAQNSGDVDGPASATDNAIARFDGDTGKLVQNSGCTIDDDDNVTLAGNLEVQTGGTVGIGEAPNANQALLVRNTSAGGATEATVAITSAAPSDDVAVALTQSSSAVSWALGYDNSANSFAINKSTTLGANPALSLSDTNDACTLNGTLTVDGDHIYTGDGSILNAVWGDTQDTTIQVIGNTGDVGRVTIQGYDNTSYAPAGLILIDRASDLDKRVWHVTAGMPSSTNIMALGRSKDDGTSPVSYMTLDADTVQVDFNQNVSIDSGKTLDVNGTTSITGVVTIDSGGGAISGSAAGTAGNLVIKPVTASGGGGMTLFGRTTQGANIFFALESSSTADEGQIRYGFTNNDMTFATAGTDALTIDSSQNVTIPEGDLTVGDNTRATTIDINATSASNAAIDFNEAAGIRWRLFKNSSGALLTNRYNASGAYQDVPFKIDSAGDVDIANNLTVTSGDLDVTAGDLTVTAGEVFLNLPTSAGTTGSLWNDSGVVKVA